jgi:glycosyltransferase EpsF
MQKIRVLHFLSSLNYGGIEAWLMNLLRYFRNEEVLFDFAVHGTGHFDDEVKSYGSVIHLLPPMKSFISYIFAIKKILQNGNYDCIHIHNGEFAYFLLYLASKSKIPCRVVHSHNTRFAKGEMNLQRAIRLFVYRHFTYRLNIKLATHLLGCADEATRFAFGQNVLDSDKVKICYCGIDLHPFETQHFNNDKNSLKTKYNLPSDAVIVGNIGSLSLQKNQLFLLKMFAELAKRNPRYYLFIAGEGYLRTKLEKAVAELNLTGRVLMPGNCSNIPELCSYLFDVFCFPSFFEGLPVSVHEATAGGLFTAISDTITKEMVPFYGERLQYLSLDAPLNVWADTVEEGISKRLSSKEGTEIIRQSPFCIENSAQALLKCYRSCLKIV